MTTILWHNTATIPDKSNSTMTQPLNEGEDILELKAAGGPIFIYLSDGSAIEVRPASGVRVTDDTIEVMQGSRMIAAYPRERVVLASRQPVQPQPFC